MSTWRAWIFGQPAPPNSGTPSCPVCLEALSDPTQYGSNECSHSFHEECIKRWQAEGTSDGCPTCRGGAQAVRSESAAPRVDEDNSQHSTTVRGAWLWSWLTLMILPWPTRSTAEREPEWDASRGIGDWKARLAKLQAADSEPDDDASDEADETGGMDSTSAAAADQRVASAASASPDQPQEPQATTGEEELPGDHIPDSQLTYEQLVKRHPWLAE